MKQTTSYKVSVPNDNLKSCNDQYKILIAVDCIIFGFDGTQLKALLIKRAFAAGKGKWSLMGGFVGEEEGTDEAATRVLSQLTGMQNVYTEQLYTFGEVKRDSASRVVSIAYLALMNLVDYKEPLPSEHFAKWFPLSAVPVLIRDHEKLLLKAKERLRQKAANHPIGFELLPPKFTLPQLQSLYEAIYQMPVDRRNFIRKIRSLSILNKLDEKEKSSSRKGAFYYVFDREKYITVEAKSGKFI